jgi:hypothetical protein
MKTRQNIMLNDFLVKFLNNSAYAAVRVSYRGGKVRVGQDLEGGGLQLF